MLKEQIFHSITMEPNIEGPITVTEQSYPFCSMAHTREPLDLKKYGYVEEEYFLSGNVNLYQEDGDSMYVKEKNLPYKNRIMIRKPENKENFSGRVFIDIYNASNGYDIEDVWRRSYQYFLENGHIYIGITSKPINVWSLKNYDYERYKSLDWSAVKNIPQPTIVKESMSIPGTEEGLFWDMLSQLAVLIRKEKADFLKDYTVDYLYLTGQSQSGIYLNTYIYYFNDFLKNKDEEPLFDGYLNVVGAGVMRALNQQEDEKEMFAVRTSKISKMDVPFINISSQGDLELFEAMSPNTVPLNADNLSDNKIRHYEVASSPHTDPASVMIPANSEISKTKNPPKILDSEYNYTVNDLKLDYYVNSALEFLHEWAANDIKPPAGKLIEKDAAGNVLMDEHGNAKGGLRSPYVDVPIATYYANAKADKDEVNPTVGNVNGSMKLFSKDKFLKLYGTKENYLEQFNHAVENQIKEGFILMEDGKRMKNWAKSMTEQYF